MVPEALSICIRLSSGLTPKKDVISNLGSESAPNQEKQAKSKTFHRREKVERLKTGTATPVSPRFGHKAIADAGCIRSSEGLVRNAG
jgi:hypothetical protein